MVRVGFPPKAFVRAFVDDEPPQHHPTSTAGRPSVEVCEKLDCICRKSLTELLRRVILACHLSTQDTQQDLQRPNSFQMDSYLSPPGISTELRPTGLDPWQATVTAMTLLHLL